MAFFPPSSRPEPDRLPAAARYLPSHLADRLDDPVAWPEIEGHLRTLLRTISTYLPRRLQRRLFQDPRPGQVWGELVEGSLLFADLSGFTSLAATLSRFGQQGAETLVGIINPIFTAMLEVIHQERGDLIGFGGDALLALFDGAAHALAAVRAAARLQAVMAGLSLVHTEAGDFDLAMHIGINSGSFLTASVGQERAMQYVLLGKAVEETARAEALAGPGETVASASIARLAGDEVRWEPLGDDRFRLSGVSLSPLPAPEEPTPALLLEGDPLALLDTLTPYLPAGLLERLLPYPSEPTVEAELKPVAVLFANLLGFEPLLDRPGEDALEQAVALLQRYMVAMQQVVERYEGTLNKMDLSQEGGKLLVLFGAPVKHEDDADRAVRAALDMYQEVRQLAPELAALGCSLNQRVGLHMGEVFAGNVGAAWRKEYTVMGTPVNLAARVMAAAPPGAVWATGTLYERVRATVQTEEERTIRVKGWAGPLEVHPIRDYGPAVRPAPALPLVGREEELARLKEALESACRGEGQLVSLVGEAGVGKSRLVEEAVALAHRLGMHILLSRTPSYGERVPYSPWAELLRALLGWAERMPADEWAARLRERLSALGEEGAPWAPVMAEALGLPLPDTPQTAGLPPRLRRQRFFDLTLHLLRDEAARRPLLLILEDLHWAGPLAGELLVYVGRNVTTSPLTVLVTCRPRTEPFPWEGLLGHQEIALKPFAFRETVALIAALNDGREIAADLAQLVWERAQGNPLFVEEIVRALQEKGRLLYQEGGVQIRGDLEQAREEVPLTIQEVVLSRIDRLREELRSVLRVASVIDQEFLLPVLVGIYPHDALAPVLRARVEGLCQVGMLLPAGPETYAFRHALTREVAYQSLLHARRQALHEQVGRYYEAHFAARLEQYYGFLAYHYGRSLNLGKGLEYALKAGRQAARSYANEAAADYFRQALEIAVRCPDLLPPRQAVQVLRERGDLLWQAGHFAQALASYQEAREKGRYLLQDVETAELYRLCSFVHERTGRYEESLDALQTAHQILLRTPAGMDSLEMARVLTAIGAVYWRMGEYEQARRYGEEALAIARRAPAGRERSSLIGRIYVQQGNLALVLGQYRQAVEAFQQGLHFHQEAGEKDRVAIAYNNMGYTWHFQDAYQEAIESYLRCLEVAQQIGDPYVAAYAANNLGSAWYELGDYDLAMSYCEQSLAVRERIGDQAGIASCWDTMGLIQAARGEYDWAMRLHRKSHDLKRVLQDNFQQANSLINIAQVHLERGEFQAALTLGREAIQMLEKLGTQTWLDEAQLTVAQALLGRGEMTEARRHAETARRIAADTGGRKHSALAARVLAEVLAADPEADREEARRLFEESIATLSELSCRREWARSCRAYARLLQEMGLAEGAQKHRETARRLWAEIGLPESEEGP